MLPASAHRAPTLYVDDIERQASFRRPALLVAVGIAALAVGLLVYLTDRDPTKASLIPAVGWLRGSVAFGAVGGSLPTFAHTFAFSLFTAAALPVRFVPSYGVCVAWFAVNAVFEIGQHPLVSEQLTTLFGGHLGGLPLTHALTNYFVLGTFDLCDVAAALIGAIAAGVVLRAAQPRNREKA